MLDTLLELVRSNALLAYFIVAGVCFGESFAFISLLVPGWAFMLAAGALVGSGVLNPALTILAAAAGATLGDSVSYWIGLYFKELVPRIWPFTRHPEWLDRGHDFFRKWGAMSVFLGRFFGPLRAVVPLAAGMMEMPNRTFWIANVASAIPWAAFVVGVGWGGAELVNWIVLNWKEPWVQVLVWSAVALAVVAYAVIHRWWARRT